MPLDASALGDAPLLRALFLGSPKVGKTTTLVTSALEHLGPGYVICCSTAEHLRTPRILTKESPTKWAFDIVKSVDNMESAIKAARAGDNSGAYKWVLVDDMNLFANVVEEAMCALHKGDGRKYWGEYARILRNTLLRLFDLKCHVMATMHYYETGAELDGQVTKHGPGIVPSLAGGRVRQEIPGLFNQVIWMDRDKTGERVFLINPPVLGVGCQGVKGASASTIPANLGTLLSLF